MSTESTGPAESSLTSLAPLVTRVDHVGVAVRDLDEAAAFYSRVFGLSVIHEETNEEQGVREAMIGFPDGTGAQLQLLAPLRADSAIGKFLERNGQGIQQVAYTVTDIDAACERVRAAGIRVLYDEPRRGTAGSRINFLHPKDAMGILVELVEHPESGRSAH